MNEQELKKKRQVIREMVARQYAQAVGYAWDEIQQGRYDPDTDDDMPEPYWDYQGNYYSLKIYDQPHYDERLVECLDFANDTIKRLSSLGVVIADKDSELPQRTWLFTDRLTSRPETVDEYKERLKGYTKTHSLLEER